MIDLTKPLQTVGDAEHPSEPVTLITTEGRGIRSLIGYIGNADHLSSWATSGRLLYSGNRCRLDLQNVPETKHIDWSKMPVGTVVTWRGRYYYFLYKNNVGLIELSLTKEANGVLPKPLTSAPHNEVRIIQGEWQPWFGGDCPVPEGVLGDIVMRDGIRVTHIHLCSHNWWQHDLSTNRRGEIIAYRIEGCAKGWTE